MRSTPTSGAPADARTTKGALQGIRVLELGSLIAGPLAGRMLADFGAEVIKVEGPDRPDPLRDWGNVRQAGHTLWWSVQSRNKKCITLDIASTRGHDLFLQLVADSDILIENMRPGTLERLGLGPDLLHQTNAELIIARVSGFGQDGPYARRAGYASVAEAISGLRHLNGYPDQPPPRTGISLGDSLASLFALQGILLALHARNALGVGGQVIDVSLVESCFAMLEGIVPEYAATGEIRGPSGTGLKGIAPSNIFRCADDTWFIIAANQDSVFRRLCDVMGMPSLADDPRFKDHASRGDNQDEIESMVADWAAQFTSKELDGVLTAAGVPCGPIYSVADIFSDPLFRDRQMLLRVMDPEIGELTLPGIVPKLSRTPGSVSWPGPLEAGQHNGQVYREILNLSDDTIADLRRESTI